MVWLLFCWLRPGMIIISASAAQLPWAQGCLPSLGFRKSFFIIMFHLASKRGLSIDHPCFLSYFVHSKQLFKCFWKRTIRYSGHGGFPSGLCGQPNALPSQPAASMLGDPWTGSAAGPLSRAHGLKRKVPCWVQEESIFVPLCPWVAVTSVWQGCSVMFGDRGHISRYHILCYNLLEQQGIETKRNEFSTF